MADGQRIGFGYKALGTAAVIGGGIVYLITSVIGTSKSETPAEEAAREFIFGQKPAVTYKASDQELTLTVYGIRGLNKQKPKAILVPGADANNDGFPDNLGKLVVRTLDGKEITPENARAGNLDGLTFKLVPVYTQPSTTAPPPAPPGTPAH